MQKFEEKDKYEIESIEMRDNESSETWANEKKRKQN